MRDVDVFQVVLARAADHDLPARPLPARAWRLDRPLAAQIRAGERAVAVLQQLRGRALEDHACRRAPPRPARGRRRSPPGGSSLRRARRRRRCCRDRAAARASRAGRGCRAGAGRWTARRARRARRSGWSRSASRAGSAGLLRPRASRRCARASDIRHPTSSRKCRRSRISRRIRLAISASRSESSISSKTRTASLIGRVTNSEIVRPLTRTARLCAFRRSPAQLGHGRSERYGSRFSCSSHVPSS